MNIQEIKTLTAPHTSDCCDEILVDGIMIWYNKEGIFHRVNGPARIFPSGKEEWYLQGKRHNLNGPAIIYPDRRERWHNDGTFNPNGKYEYTIQPYLLGRKRLGLLTTTEAIREDNVYKFVAVSPGRVLRTILLFL